ncbi:MAG: nucleotidyltransferase [Firmicutes bacterium]|nr:nucleotidyltransferase [Bacillota bacterium]
MTKEPTLIIMAAGMGSRYGGLKQVEKMTDTGEIILDFSLYDAMMAGFKRAVFVIRQEHRDIFRELVDERAGRFMEIEYAYQKLDDIPEGVVIPEGREKPWGTGHAIYACRDLIDGPFAVINADDYYGPQGFVDIYDYLTSHEDDDKMKLCMAGYILGNTITENGHVARGVCQMDGDNFLTSITERTMIMQRPEGISFTEDEGKSWTVLPDDTLVSMNFWGLSGGMIRAIGGGMAEFFETRVPENPLKSEYLLPTIIDGLIRSGKAEVKVLPCHEKWCGVTYKEDKEAVKAELQSKKDKGLYPEKLWK